MTFRADGTARRITEARAKKLLTVGGRVGYRSPSRYIHLTEKRNTSSRGLHRRSCKKPSRPSRTSGHYPTTKSNLPGGPPWLIDLLAMERPHPTTWLAEAPLLRVAHYDLHPARYRV